MNMEYFRASRMFRSLLLVFFLVIFISLVMNNSVNVYGAEGGGAGSSGGAANCDSNALTTLCGNPAGSKGGGASWRIFKTAGNAPGLDDWDGYSEDILEDSYKDEALTACASTGWFASFGWDGMKGSHYGYDDYKFQIGPANRNTGELIRSAAHNTYNALKKNDVAAKIKNNDYNYANNTRITRPAALLLYNEYRKSVGKDTVTSMPDKVGWFCLDAKDEYTLEVKGVNIYDGSDLVAGNKSKTTTQDETKIKRKGLGSKGYKFIGWKTKKGYDGHKSGLTDIITRTGYTTDSNGNPINSYVSDDAKDGDGNVIKYNNGTKNVKSIVHVRGLSSDSDGTRVMYAYYAPQCVLTMSQGEGTTLSASRTTSPYAFVDITHRGSGAHNTYKGDKWAVSAALNYGYSWVNQPSSSYTTGGSGANCNNLTLTTTAVKNKFKGKATVSGGGSSNSVGFTDSDSTPTNKKAALIKINCPSTGCSATFSMDLKTTQGSGNTKYTIYKGDSDKVDEKSVAPSSSGSNVGSFTVDMKQGDLVCYKMKFDTIPADNKNATIWACAAAVATETASISIDIKDMTSSSKYRDWQSNHNRYYVYAKPEDTVELKGTFTPRYQYMVGLMPVTTKIGSNSYSNNGKNIRTVFDDHMNPNWNNAFSIDLLRGHKCLNINNNNVFSGTIGSPNSYPNLSDNPSICGYWVGVADVGNDIEANAVTNSGDDTKNTPKQVSLDYSFENGFVASINNNSISSDPSVHILVPYNFKNSTYIKRESDDLIVYAGESKTVNPIFRVGAIRNNETNGTYATNVPGAMWELQVQYNGGQWETVYNGEGEMNKSSYNKDGKDEPLGDRNGLNIDIKDLPAGSEFCVKSRIYPVYSGGNTNLNASNFYGWGEGKACYTIAKRPSFQVWGGNVYSAKDIKTSVAKKHINGTVRFFGSWTELGLMVNGTVTGMASGAGMGYGNNSSVFENGVWPGYHPTQWGNKGNNNVPGNSYTGGGKGGESFCLRSTLTFANEECIGDSAGFGGTGGIDSGEDRHDLISDFVPGDKTKYSLNGDEFSWYALNNDNIVRLNHHVQDSEVEYYYDSASNGSLSVNFQYYDTIIPVKRESNRGTYTNTIVIDSERDVHLMSNIYYENGNYTAIEDIPKVIIYSKKNISIDCSVQRIDAVLIAEGDINTCYSGEKNEENYNGESNSNQLIINGATISNTLTLNRTYGAATVFNSIISAEIINYDTSLYLWANKQTNVTGSGTMKEASVRELAPRY